MPISYDRKTMCFRLSSRKTTYALAVKEGYICHLYFGSLLNDCDDLTYLLNNSGNSITVTGNLRDKASAMDLLPQEYPCFNTGDFREHALEICDINGAHACELKYKAHSIYDGKPKLQGLPAAFAGSSEAQTLEIICNDVSCGLEVKLLYTVFEELGVITRSAVITNNSDSVIKLERAFSASLDINRSNLDMITLNGSWARECHVSRHSLHQGKQSVDSIRGESSHQHNPFFALCDHNADENNGEVYGFSFMYSGNFVAQAEVSQHGTTRASIGINPLLFEWTLNSGESFTAPEVILVYSDSGIGEMSRIYHDFFRNHVIRSKYKFVERPILINNWEATYFNFNSEKLIEIAREASKLGIEMLVMDDGWFGHRDSDNSSLGDWYIYTEKLGDSLRPLVEEVNALGMKFGIWFEPEMVSPDSELFRTHPDWALRIPGREMTMSREQYVLDFSRKDVRDYIYNLMYNILTSANIEYVKWDMNRPLTEVWSAASVGKQGEISHRYVMGVYEFMERLITDFPDLLLENCSGGGGRFDGAMLYYSPQIWASDDTDAYERLKIQHGTSIVYPPSAMGAHVSDCPNHLTGRNIPFATRGYTALAGTFGYELDITKISDDEKKAVSLQISDYKKYSHLVRNGDQYRLGNVFENNHWDAWMFVSKDKCEAILTYVQTYSTPNYPAPIIKLQGLAKDKLYNVGDKYVLSGETLMKCGLPMKKYWGDFMSELIYIREKESEPDEIWDGYNADGSLAGVNIVRGGDFPSGLYHAVAEVIVRHTDGSYLAMQRDFSKEAHSGEWEIGAGGSVIKGESFFDAAVRELFEETGIHAEKLKKLYQSSKVHENGVGALYIGYLCETDIDKRAIKLQNGETIDYKWLSAEEITAGDYIPQRKAKAVKDILIK